MKKRRILIIAGVLATGLVIVTALFVVMMKNPALPATVADNVLRPIIGEKATLTLESYYFGISEQIKKIQYLFVQPDTSVLYTGDSSISVQNTHNDDMMNLNPLPLNPNLKPIDGEGIWKILPQTLFPNEAVIAKTFIRPDQSRPYATVAIAQFDMKKLAINTEAGVKYPGGTQGIPGPGLVPQNIQQSNKLLAVFNGGFQYKDGQYGMIVGQNTYVPLRKGLGTLFMFGDGSVKLTTYNGEPIGINVVSIRQNGPLLVDKGEITQFVEEGKDTWGRTTTNSMYTWRSGIGITKNGDILYAVGGSLVPATLARALQSAGAVTAMQLDINPFWVRCFFYASQGNGKYTFTPLLKDMKTGGAAYLHGYEKDFFYVYGK